MNLLLGMATVQYVYDGTRVIEERNGAGTLQKQYLRGSVFQMQTSAGVFWLHEGANGSIAAVTDDTGTVVEAYQYGAYGQTTVTLGTGTLNDYRYLGVRFDAETSFYTGDVGGSYLSTTLGQFMTRDGASGWTESGGLGNGFCFSGNDGVNATWIGWAPILNRAWLWFLDLWRRFWEDLWKRRPGTGPGTDPDDDPNKPPSDPGRCRDDRIGNRQGETRATNGAAVPRRWNSPELQELAERADRLAKAAEVSERMHQAYALREERYRGAGLDFQDWIRNAAAGGGEGVVRTVTAGGLGMDEIRQTLLPSSDPVNQHSSEYQWASAGGTVVGIPLGGASISVVGRGIGKVLPAVGKWWMRGAEGDAAWARLSLKEKVIAELGAKSFPGGLPAQLAGLSNLEKGRHLIAAEGWAGAMLPTFEGLLLGARSGALATGPTAGVRAGVPALLSAAQTVGGTTTHCVNINR